MRTIDLSEKERAYIQLLLVVDTNTNSQFLRNTKADEYTTQRKEAADKMELALSILGKIRSIN